MTEGKMRKVGALWKPRQGAKHLGFGSITVNGLKQKFYVFANTRKARSEKAPDFELLSSDEPEVDQYEADRAHAKQNLGRGRPVDSEDIAW